MARFRDAVLDPMSLGGGRKPNFKKKAVPLGSEKERQEVQAIRPASSSARPAGRSVRQRYDCSEPFELDVDSELAAP